MAIKKTAAKKAPAKKAPAKKAAAPKAPSLELIGAITYPRDFVRYGATIMAKGDEYMIRFPDDDSKADRPCTKEDAMYYLTGKRP